MPEPRYKELILETAKLYQPVTIEKVAKIAGVSPYCAYKNLIQLTNEGVLHKTWFLEPHYKHKSHRKLLFSTEPFPKKNLWDLDGLMVHPLWVDRIKFGIMLLRYHSRSENFRQWVKQNTPLKDVGHAYFLMQLAKTFLEINRIAMSSSNGTLRGFDSPSLLPDNTHALKTFVEEWKNLVSTRQKETFLESYIKLAQQQNKPLSVGRIMVLGGQIAKSTNH